MVEVLCLWSLLAGNAGIWRKQVSEFQSGYLTMIPVGAYLKLPQQDIDVNGSDGRAARTWDRSPHRPPPRTEPPSIANALGAIAIFL
jgi:hypothetical protein